MPTSIDFTDLQLQRLTWQAHLLMEEDLDAQPRRSRVRSATLDDGSKRSIVEFLLRPYDNGYWELQSGWNSASPYTRYLLDTLDLLRDVDREELGSGVVAARRAARRLANEQRDAINSASLKLSTLFEIFRRCVVDDTTTPAPEWRENLDYRAFATRWSEAVEYFRNNIYFDGFLTNVQVEKPFKIASGVVVFFELPKDHTNLVAVGLSRASLDPLQNFLKMLGVLKDSQIQRVFAPDEQLFKPYFAFVSSVLPEIVSDRQISKLFSDALAYYQDSDYQHCISSLGLIAEDHLQRIFTTLIREQAPTGVTLGQLVAQISQKIDQLAPSPKPILRPFDVAFQKINEISEGASAAQTQTALREIVSLIADDRSFNKSRLEEATRPPTKRNVFPSGINSNLNELIKWRNAASHNSRVPLSAHEADRSLFCLVTIIAWWQEQLRNLDWSQDKATLINQLIAQAKP